MISRSFVIPTLVLLWMILIFASPSQHKADWKGTVEQIDSVTVVKNPKEPMYGEGVFHIEEELSIGEEGRGDEYLLSKPRDVAVDEEKKLYILDSYEAHVKVFDKNGKYKGIIGKKGQGPGEMSTPSSIQITPQNEIAVNDPAARKIHFFSLDGNFLRALSQRNLNFFSDPKIDREGNITASYMTVTKEATYYLKKFNTQLKESLHIFSGAVLKYPELNFFYPECYWDLFGESNLVWGFAGKYELFIIDPEGNTIKRITREYDPIKITDEDKKNIIEQRIGGRENIDSKVRVVWDEHHNPFIYLCVDDEGRIYTQTYEKEPKSGYYYHDVFDRDGKYMVKILLKSRPYVIKKGKLYTIEEDEEGYQLVKRYKIIWRT